MRPFQRPDNQDSWRFDEEPQVLQQFSIKETNIVFLKLKPPVAELVSRRH